MFVYIHILKVYRKPSSHPPLLSYTSWGCRVSWPPLPSLTPPMYVAMHVCVFWTGRGGGVESERILVWIIFFISKCYFVCSVSPVAYNDVDVMYIDTKMFQRKLIIYAIDCICMSAWGYLYMYTCKYIWHTYI